MMDAQERDLLSRCQKGEEKAFQTLYEKYKDYVFTLAFRLLGDREDAEDLLQEVFIKFFEKCLTFRGEAKLSTWLYRVTVNACLTFREKRSLRQHSPLKGDFEEEGEAKNLAEEKEKIQATLKKLKKKERVILSLKLLRQLTYEEIGQILDLNTDQVRGRIYRAKIKFRKLYEE